jgi:hypothetical protein
VGEVVADCIGRDDVCVAQCRQKPEVALDEGETVRAVGERSPDVGREEVNLPVVGLAAGDDGAKPVGG